MLAILDASLERAHKFMDDYEEILTVAQQNRLQGAIDQGQPREQRTEPTSDECTDAPGESDAHREEPQRDLAR